MYFYKNVLYITVIVIVIILILSLLWYWYIHELWHFFFWMLVWVSWKITYTANSWLFLLDNESVLNTLSSISLIIFYLGWIIFEIFFSTILLYILYIVQKNTNNKYIIFVTYFVMTYITLVQIISIYTNIWHPQTVNWYNNDIKNIITFLDNDIN